MTLLMAAVSAMALSYNVLQELPHDATSFTQGLVFHNGILYESSGQYGYSKVSTIDPSTGDIIAKSDLLATNYFGEGLVYNTLDDTLIQLTWKNRVAFVYDPTSLDMLYWFEFSTTRNEGWGITLEEDSQMLIVSDGSSYLHFWNATNYEEIKRVQVLRKNGVPVDNLNELEYVPELHRVFSNIWYSDEILSIDPDTGIVEESLDLSDLWPISERPPEANVLNGIALTNIPGEMFLTGKYWSKMFRIQVCFPSLSPTEVASSLPSLANKVSLSPSFVPTNILSNKPTLETNNPSLSPAGIPSSLPSLTKKVSLSPSSVPPNILSNKPTLEKNNLTPSQSPSANDANDSAPSFSPTNAVTSDPSSRQRNYSLRPSFLPSKPHFFSESPNHLSTYPMPVCSTHQQTSRPSFKSSSSDGFRSLHRKISTLISTVIYCLI